MPEQHMKVEIIRTVYEEEEKRRDGHDKMSEVSTHHDKLVCQWVSVCPGRKTKSIFSPPSAWYAFNRKKSMNVSLESDWVCFIFFLL